MKRCQKSSQVKLSFFLSPSLSTDVPDRIEFFLCFRKPCSVTFSLHKTFCLFFLSPDNSLRCHVNSYVSKQTWKKINKPSQVTFSTDESFHEQSLQKAFVGWMPCFRAQLVRQHCKKNKHTNSFRPFRGSFWNYLYPYSVIYIYLHISTSIM